MKKLGAYDAESRHQGAVSGLLEGETGVYKLEVVRKETAPDLDNYAPYAKAVTGALVPRVNSAVIEALKAKADIEDNRALYY